MLEGATRGVLGLALCCVVARVGAGASRSRPRRTVWQIDPERCVQCGRCATECVLPASAVRCVHDHAMCGYCERCFAYFKQRAPGFDAGAENQQCPTGALKRSFVESPYFEYDVVEELCIGCGVCVKGCQAFGNGSLYLQVRHDRCLGCNECRIAASCPAQAFGRRPASGCNTVKHLGTNPER